MEIRILDSILHGQLKPWKFDTGNARRLVEVIRSAQADGSAITRLQTLLHDFPLLQRILAEDDEPPTVQPLYFQPQLPADKDPGSRFYNLLISWEAQRVFSVLLHRSREWKEIVDVIYHVSNTLNNVKVLTLQTSDELRERGFTSMPDQDSNLIHFVLFYLKHSLIALYFSIQEAFKATVQQTTTPEDFYLLDLQEPLSGMIPLNSVASAGENEGAVKNTVEQEKIAFGFKDDVQKLTTVINQLCHQIELLNEEVAEADDLIKVLTAKSFLPGAVKIQINCETKHFRYIINKLRHYFNELSLINIERSKVFYSKNNKLITANNLSVSGSGVEPKEKATIDRIFKNLQ